MINKIPELHNRPDLLKIAEMIPHGAKVLDLGCGDGALLRYLKEHKAANCIGIELSQDKILECVSKGVPVIHGNLDDGLGELKSRTFDVIILSQTLQTIRRPEKLLPEMARVGKNVLISFLNIGHYSSRFQLVFYGKMPVTKSLPYEWYNTPNIHLGTIKDFINLCRGIKIEIIEKIPVNRKYNFAARIWPNLFAETCIFSLKSAE